MMMMMTTTTTTMTHIPEAVQNMLWIANMFSIKPRHFRPMIVSDLEVVPSTLMRLSAARVNHDCSHPLKFVIHLIG